MKWLKKNYGCLNVSFALLVTINLLLVIFVPMPAWLSLPLSIFFVTLAVINLCLYWYCKKDKEISEFKN